MKRPLIYATLVAALGAVNTAYERAIDAMRDFAEWYNRTYVQTREWYDRNLPWRTESLPPVFIPEPEPLPRTTARAVLNVRDVRPHVRSYTLMQNRHAF